MDPSYNVYRPIVVPFAFFRNNGPGTPVPFDNMSRLMATSIFSSQVTDWNQFDPTLPSLPIVVCMRHAGSGTHATLDAAVMRGDYNLEQYEALPGSFPVTSGFQSVTYFNDGSSDLMRCVGGAAGAFSGYTGQGAVGYADADKVVMTPPITGTYSGSYGEVKLMTWQGETAEKKNIVNGKYDFWSAQWLYASSGESTEVLDLIDALAAFASDPANLALSGKGDYWAAQDEMMVEKATDFTYPSFK
jgi:ABC-type phosphate transport system substrate-binding protein